MSNRGYDAERSKSAAPMFVASCAVGFLIISVGAAYFIVSFFV